MPIIDVDDSDDSADPEWDKNNPSKDPWSHKSSKKRSADDGNKPSKKQKHHERSHKSSRKQPVRWSRSLYEKLDDSAHALHEKLDDYVAECAETFRQERDEEINQLTKDLDDARKRVCLLQKEKSDKEAAIFELDREVGQLGEEIDQLNSNQLKSKLVVSQLLSDLSQSQRDAARNEAWSFAYEYRCLMCQTPVTRARDGVAIADCGNPEHCVCKDCLPGFVRFEITSLCQKDAHAEEPSTQLRCPYRPEMCGSGTECDGKWGRDELRDACNGVLRSSRESDGRPTDLERIDAWERDAILRGAENARRRLSDNEKRQSEFITEVQENMRAVNWLPLDPERNCVFECPECKYGPVVLGYCNDLQAHHGQIINGVALNNACHRCGFFAPTARGTPLFPGRANDGWDVWSGIPDKTFLDNLSPRRRDD
jgi:hypothetical protein